MIVRIYTWVFWLLLAFVSIDALAESIPATQNSPAKYQLYSAAYGGVPVKHSAVVSAGQVDAEFQLLCDAISGHSGLPRHTIQSTSVGGQGYCYLSDNGFRRDFLIQRSSICSTGTLSGSYPGALCLGAYSCPAGYTLNGNMCDPVASCPMYGTPEGNTAPQDPPGGCSCPSGHEWVPLNGCRKLCDYASQSGQEVQAMWQDFLFPAGKGEGCHQGCIINPVGEFAEYDNGSRTSRATWTKWACGQDTPPALQPEGDKKEPPCSPTEGVLTTSTGDVKCVPPGDPSKGTPSGRAPEEKKTKKKETFPDGSEKQTETTETKDPKTGATHSKSTTTSTGGQAGPAGTTTSVSGSGPVGGTGGNGNGSGDGDEGDCEGDNCSPGEFPDTEGLYEKKFENGIKGVLNARYTQLLETPLFQLGNTLAPTNVPNSGACSPFSLSMNIGPRMNFGSGAIQVPCYVWSFIRMVMLISAFLLARRLIFGG